jgi:hypothetical protein
MGRAWFPSRQNFWPIINPTFRPAVLTNQTRQIAFIAIRGREMLNSARFKMTANPLEDYLSELRDIRRVKAGLKLHQ